MAEAPRALKADTVEVKKDSLDKVATAIESMVAANQAKSLPVFGPRPTDEAGKPIEPHCSYFDSDGKERECVIEGGKFNPRSWPNPNEDPNGTKIKNTAHCIAFYVRVNFKVKNVDNWLPVCGVYDKSNQRATVRRDGKLKPYIVLNEEQLAKYKLNFTSDKKLQLPLPPGITL